MTLNPLAALMACVTAIFGFTTLYGAPKGLSEPLSVTPTTVWVDNGYTDAPTTTITIPTTVASCDDAIAVAEAVGWPVEELDTLRHILSRESGPTCAPTAFNASDPTGGSYGVAQLNGVWCLPNSQWPIGWLQAQGLIEQCTDLFNAETNLRSALAIWHNSGWGPWATTKP